MPLTQTSTNKIKNDMTKRILTTIMLLTCILTTVSQAQTTPKKVYDESLNPLEQIEKAVTKAKDEGKYVICQVGGNWCPWCLRFAEFMSNDEEISKLVDENFVYIHVNYRPRQSGNSDEVERGQQLMKRLNNAGRFGFPVMVVLDEEGRVLHIQDSSFLEEGKSYNKEKVMRFFANWTRKAVKP